MNPLLVVGLASLGFALALASLVGGMARAGHAPRSLSRKVFHAAIFSGAVPAQLLQGFWGVMVYGSVVALIVLVAYWQGPGSAFYDGLARPSDGRQSHRSILVPLLATALGGLLSTLLVGSFAVVGYLVCGWGDAVGEPVGERWGRHRYSTPLASRCTRTRSLEGSVAVFLAGSLGALMAILLLGYPLSSAIWIAFACGGIGAIVEGLSGPETDNLWVQLGPALLAWWVLG